MSYIPYAYELYKNKIFPHIKESVPVFTDETLKNSVYDDLIEYCVYEDNPTGRRFYPSALFVLFYQALTNKEPSADILKVAASLELFHNSSLCHDDVIDNHSLRREKPTIVNNHGQSIALLVGNMMIGMTDQILSDNSSAEITEIRKEFARAIHHLNYGQYLDEKKVWADVSQNQWPAHWSNIIRYKMIVGFLALRLAAVCANRKDDILLLDQYEYAMSVISQIINDTGDLYKFYGYYLTTKTNRPSGEETLQKVTYPLVWLVEEQIVVPTFAEDKQLYLRELQGTLAQHDFGKGARARIEEFREVALGAINELNLVSSDYKEIIFDFTRTPNIPEKLDFENAS